MEEWLAYYGKLEDESKAQLPPQKHLGGSFAQSGEVRTTPASRGVSDLSRLAQTFLNFSRCTWICLGLARE